MSNPWWFTEVSRWTSNSFREKKNERNWNNFLRKTENISDEASGEAQPERFNQTLFAAVGSFGKKLFSDEKWWVI